MEGESPSLLRTETTTASGLSRTDEHADAETCDEVTSSELTQCSSNNNTLSNSYKQSALPITLSSNNLTSSRPATSKLNGSKTAEIAWQKPSSSVTKKVGKKKTPAPTVVKMSYFDSPVETATKVIPKQQHQTNYKTKKKKKKAPVAKAVTSHNKALTDGSHTAVDSMQPAASVSDRLPHDDDKVDMSKLSLNSSPVSRISTRSDVSTVRVTRRVERRTKLMDHSNVSEHVSPTSDAARSDSGIASSTSNHDDVTTTANKSTTINNTSTVVSVKSVNYESTEINYNNPPHLQKVIRHSSPIGQSSRKSK